MCVWGGLKQPRLGVNRSLEDMSTNASSTFLCVVVSGLVYFINELGGVIIQVAGTADRSAILSTSRF